MGLEGRQYEKVDHLQVPRGHPQPVAVKNVRNSNFFKKNYWKEHN